MVIVRLLLVALLIVAGVTLLAWAITGDRRYLRYLGKLLRVALIAAIVMALLFVGERTLLAL